MTWEVEAIMGNLPEVSKLIRKKFEKFLAAKKEIDVLQILIKKYKHLDLYVDRWNRERFYDSWRERLDRMNLSKDLTDKISNFLEHLKKESEEDFDDDDRDCL